MGIHQVTGPVNPTLRKSDLLERLLCSLGIPEEHCRNLSLYLTLSLNVSPGDLCLLPESVLNHSNVVRDGFCGLGERCWSRDPRKMIVTLEDGQGSSKNL